MIIDCYGLSQWTLVAVHIVEGRTGLARDASGCNANVKWRLRRAGFGACIVVSARGSTQHAVGYACDCSFLCSVCKQQSQSVKHTAQGAKGSARRSIGLISKGGQSVQAPVLIAQDCSWFEGFPWGVWRHPSLRTLQVLLYVVQARRQPETFDQLVLC